MPLTTMEAIKVTGATLTALGEKGEKFENENPGEKYKPTIGDITALAVQLAQQLGIEIMD